MVRQASVICVMAPPIHLGAWSMALNAMAAFCVIMDMVCSTKFSCTLM